MVTAWIDACPEGATWPNLVEALTEMGRRKNAKQVAEKRGQPCSVLSLRERETASIAPAQSIAAWPHSTMIDHTT